MIYAPITAALLLQAAVTPGDAERWARDLAKVMDDWKICVMVTAKNWAGQEGPPGDIVAGAYGQCASRLRLVETTAAQSPYLTAADASKIANDMRETWRERAIALVIQTRSKTSK